MWLILTVLLGAETNYVIERPCIEIVKELYREPTGFPKLPTKNIRFQFTAYPAQHYYKFDTVLLAPVGRVVACHKTLEVWAVGDRTIFRNRLTIEPRCRFGRRIAERIARGILAAEDGVIWYASLK